MENSAASPEICSVSRNLCVTPAHWRPRSRTLTGCSRDHHSRHPATKMSKLVAKIPVMAKAAVDSATPKFNTFLRYARVELVPPTPAEFGGVSQGFNNIIKSAKTGAWKNMPVKDAWRNTLVTAEVLCWFFIGECIGKGTLVAYQV